MTRFEPYSLVTDIKEFAGSGQPVKYQNTQGVKIVFFRLYSRAFMSIIVFKFELLLYVKEKFCEFSNVDHPRRACDNVHSENRPFTVASL